MSDGRSVRGEISLSQNRLFLNVEAARRRLAIGTGEIARIETITETAAMEKKWLFKEEGRDEKVYTGEQFPVMEFATRVTFGDGQTAEGHIISQTVFLRQEGNITRQSLVRKLEGRVNQGLDELVYVKEIAFDDPGRGGLGTIRLVARLPEGEKALRALAVNMDSAVGVAADPKDGTPFTFTQCAAGRYGLALISNQAVYLCLPASKGSSELDQIALNEIREWASEIRDFFQEHTPLYGVGGPDRAWALVRMERRSDMSLKTAGLVRRYEIWLMEKPEDEWQIVNRFLLHRQMSEQENVPRERIVIAPELTCEIIPGRDAAEIVLIPPEERAQP